MPDRAVYFEQLRVWQNAMALAVDVYKLTKQFPADEKFALTDQIRRSVSSISANIAEGFGRHSNKDKLHFYAIAYGSLLETKSFVYLANRLEYIGENETKELIESITTLQMELNAFTKAVRRYV